MAFAVAPPVAEPETVQAYGFSLLSVFGVLSTNDHAPTAVGVTDTTNEVLALVATLAAGCVVITAAQFDWPVAIVGPVTDSEAVPLLLKV